MEITLKEITKIFSQKNNTFFGGKYTWPSGAIIYHFQKQAVTGKEIDEEYLEYCEDFIFKSSFKDLSKLYRAVYLLLHEKLSEKVFSKSEITMNVESMSPEELVEKSKEALDVVEAHYKNLSERYPDGDVPNISENMLGKAQLLIGKDDE